MRAKIEIQLKTGVLDPQGKAIAHALQSLGFQGVGAVRVGKVIELELEAATVASAQDQVQRMCEQLLANPVIESYQVQVLQG